MSKRTRRKKRRKRPSGRGVQLGFALVLFLIVAFWFIKSLPDETTSASKDPGVDQDPNRIENGIHVRTGLVEDEGLMTVVAHCTACHSAQLVIQNRMNRERWNATIRWMQETQNLWDLGKNQEIIVNYLVKNYPPIEKGRRENLKNIDWYDLPE